MDHRPGDDRVLLDDPATGVRYEHIRFLSDMDGVSSASGLGPPGHGGGHAAGHPPACRPPGAAEAALAPMGRRLQACLRSLRARSIAEAYQQLARRPEQIAVAASALLIGVTEFFRDADVFAYLHTKVLPPWKSRDGRIGVWSAACADGAELYSVAMLLAEQGLLERSWLLGTDCRAEAIRDAQRGWFASARLDRLDRRLRRLYFVAGRGGGQVCQRLRDAVDWRLANLLGGPVPAGEAAWDLVLCRNLAIYLQPAASARLWRGLIAALRPGGVLVVGRAERPEGQRSLVRLAPCIFQKAEVDNEGHPA